jgi:hypothetical protein
MPPRIAAAVCIAPAKTRSSISPRPPPPPRHHRRPARRVDLSPGLSSPVAAAALILTIIVQRSLTYPGS